MTIDHLSRTGPGGDRSELLAADFDRETLSGLRHTVADHARMYSLTEDEIGSFVLAVNEILANAIMHGGGSGYLRMWRTDDALHCRVSDDGPGMEPERQRPQGLPPLTSGDGRGLWLARRFCDVAIAAGPAGTTVDLRTPLRPRACAVTGSSRSGG